MDERLLRLNGVTGLPGNAKAIAIYGAVSNYITVA